MQIAAYAMAHDYVHGSSIQKGIIMVCTPDLYYQEFKIEGHELRQWKHKFLKRLDEYYKTSNNLHREPEFYSNILLKKELLGNFEKNKIKE
jgi:hypothetical protein